MGSFTGIKKLNYQGKIEPINRKIPVIKLSLASSQEQQGSSSGSVSRNDYDPSSEGNITPSPLNIP
jgi:hypothetical protein